MFRNFISSSLLFLALAPAARLYSAEEFTADSHTTALYHFNDSLGDSSGNGYALAATGSPTFEDDNLGWMTVPSGKAVRLSAIGDVLTASIPDSKILPNTAGVQFTLEARIYVRNYLAHGIGNYTILSVSQAWDTRFELSEGKWDSPACARFYCGPDLVVTNSVWNANVARNAWHHLRIVMGAGGMVYCFVDDNLLSCVQSNLNKARTTAWTVTLGNIDADIDELRISDTVRGTIGADGSEFEADSNTVGLYHFTTDANDSSGNSLNLALSGNAQLAADNSYWMRTPAGKVLRLSALGDKAEVSIPNAYLAPASGGLTLESMIYVRSYLAFGQGDYPVVSLFQDDSMNIELIDGISNSPHAPRACAGQNIIVGESLWNSSVTPNQWYAFRMTLDTLGNAHAYLNDMLISTSQVNLDYNLTGDWTLSLGNFSGDIDEVRVSNISRSAGSGMELAADQNTIAMYNFNTGTGDSSGNGYDLALHGGAEIAPYNLSWMQVPSGKLLRVKKLGDYAEVSIPDSVIMPGTTPSAVTLEARAYFRKYLAHNVGTYEIISLRQAWDAGLGFTEGSNNQPQAPAFTAGTSTLLDSMGWQSNIETGRWCSLKITLDTGGDMRLFIDGRLVSQKVVTMNWGRWADPWILTMGNFEGEIDDVRISRTVRYGDDYDGDGLTVSQEQQYGTSSTLADSDGDGLTDYEEAMTNHTNPNAADTDGDGISDYEEVRNSFTDPNTADFNGISADILAVNGSSASSMAGRWEISGTGIYAVSRNGSVSYTLALPSMGTYRLAVEGTQHSPLSSQGTFLLKLNIDNTCSGSGRLVAPYGTNGTVYFYLPELAAGAHTATIVWENILDGTFLRINSLRLQSVDGPDSDSDGVADWISNRLSNMSSVTVLAQSKVSPVCAEGANASYIDQTGIAGFYTPQGETPEAPAIMRGPLNTWYSNISLSPSGDTSLTFSFQNGAKTIARNSTWTETNVLTESSQLKIRTGDSLLLTAFPQGAVSGTIAITVGGDQLDSISYDVNHSRNSAAYKFENAGDITVSATYTPGGGDPVSREISVKVIGCSFSGTPICLVGDQRVWDNPGIPDEAVLAHDQNIAISEFDLDPGRSLKVLATSAAPAYVTARLGENGPIMASAMMAATAYSIPEAYLTVIASYSDGSQLLEGTIVLSALPEGVTVKLSVTSGGLTFDDGTTVKYLTASDFDVNGVYRYRILRPESISGTTTCHNIAILQDDQQISR